jgi:hypothetical protein
LVPLAMLSRLEQWLGRFTLYRIPRHVLRLMVLGAWCIKEDIGIPTASLRMALVLPWLADPTHSQR